MIKKIGTLVFFISFFKICSAPTLCDKIIEDYKKFAISEMKRWEREKEFIKWCDHLRFVESDNRWTIVNQIGCIGTYQFQVATLNFLGFSGITVKKFITDPEIFPPEMQEEAFKALVHYNETALRKYDLYIGQTVKGVLITKSGLMAAAHLGGIGGVRSFLLSKKNPKDINGTSISDYLKEFQGYNL